MSPEQECSREEDQLWSQWKAGAWTLDTRECLGTCHVIRTYEEVSPSCREERLDALSPTGTGCNGMQNQRPPSLTATLHQNVLNGEHVLGSVGRGRRI